MVVSQMNHYKIGIYILILTNCITNLLRQMKNVFITIEGIITMCEYCSWSKYEKYDLYLHDEDAADIVFDDECDMVNGWEGIKGVYVQIDSDKDNRNLVNEICDFHTVSDYFHKLFAPNSDHPLPIYLHVAQTNNLEKLMYVLELEDDEEFDIKKVQLVYSYNEIAPLKDFVLAEKIMYDGRDVDVENYHNQYSHFEIASVGLYKQYEVEEFI